MCERMLVVCFCASLALPLGALAASFDCSKATTQVEKSICSNEELSRLDEALASEYRTATLAESDSRLRLDQRRWLARRNACGNTACIVKAYEARLLQLRAITCTRDLSSGACADGNPDKLPRTADGRIMLLSREECRIGFGDGGKPVQGQAEATEVQADCIEAGIYDPCDDAGGKWGEAQCAWAHAQVAQRRIRRAAERLVASARMSSLPSELKGSSERWEKARESYCGERNERYIAYENSSENEETPPDDAEKFGFCFRRLAEERAEDFEYHLGRITSANSPTERTRLLEFLRDDPLARAAQVIQ